MRVALLVAYALLALAGVHRVVAQEPDEFEGVEAPVVTQRSEPLIDPSAIPQAQDEHDLLLEGGSIAIAVLYAINYFVGKSQNKKLADKWLEASEPVLSKEFAYTGSSATPPVGLLEESKSNYKYYCTGRRFCSRFVADLQFASRHDLIARLVNIFIRPSEYLTIDVGLNAADLDPIVFGVTKKVEYNNLTKSFPELITMAKREDTNQVPDSYCFASDNIETPKTALTPKLVKFLTALEPFLDFFVITDLNAQPILGLPNSERRVLRLRFKLRNGSKELDYAEALALTTYLIDAVGSTIKLSRDMKASAQKKRVKVLAERTQTESAASTQARIQNELKEKKRQEYENMSYEEKQKYDEIQQSRQMRKRVSRKKM